MESHRLTIEEALVKSKRTEQSPSDKNKSVIKGYQTPIERIPVVPGEKSYSKATGLNKNVFNTVIFTDSIPKGMQMQKFSRLIKNRRAKIFNFPSASSQQILHYLDVHLNDKSINTVIIHIAINDLLTNSSTSGLDDIFSNIKKVTEKCLMFGVKNVLFQGWFTPLGWTCERVHVLILDFCRKNCFIYIDNRNIRSDSLYKMGFI